MPNSISKTMWHGVLISATVATASLVWLGIRLVPESTPVSRGATYLYMGDCIDCHGQPGDEFPDDSTMECTGSIPDPTHPRYEGSCRDQLAYFETVRLKRSFRKRVSSRNPNRILQGERLARKYNCFQCHGELGQGGFRNAGALKGYIPGYFGKDFDSLTRGGSAESIRAWISLGIDPALFAKPVKGTIAEFFIDHQDVSMPKFGTLPDSKIRILTDYVITLNQFGEMDAKAIRAYSRQTQRL